MLHLNLRMSHNKSKARSGFSGSRAIGIDGLWTGVAFGFQSVTTDLTTYCAGILTAFRFLLNRGLDISLCKSDRISKAGIRFTGSWYIIRDGQCIGIWIVFEPATNNRTLSELRFYEVMLILFPDWSCPPLQ